MSRSNAGFAGILCLVLVLTIATLALPRTQRSVPDPNSAPLAIKPEHLSWGSVWLQRDFKFKVPIENVSKQSVQISEVRASCACTKVAPSSFSLSPGGSQDITLQIDLQPRTAAQAENSIRDLAIELTFFIELPSKLSQSCRIRGLVKSPLAFRPARPVVAVSRSAAAGAMPYLISVRSLTDLDNLRVDGLDNYATVRVTSDSPDHRRFSLSVTPKTSLPAGPFEWQAKLHAVTVNGQSLPEVPLTIAGTVEERVTLLPPAIVFPQLAVGDVGRKTFAVLPTTKTNQILSVRLVGSAPSGIKMRPMPDSHSSAQNFEVEQRVQHLGFHKTVVSLEVRDDTKESPLRIDLPVIYFGIPHRSLGEKTGQ
jgi:hypothetical protein